MIKGLRLAFVEELRCFGRGRRIQELFGNAGTYMCEKSWINKTTPNKIQKEPNKNQKKSTEFRWI